MGAAMTGRRLLWQVGPEVQLSQADYARPRFQLPISSKSSQNEIVAQVTSRSISDRGYIMRCH